MAHLLLTVLFAALFAPIFGQVDLTRQSGGTGSEVVLAVISKIEATKIFGSDSRILRRIAYVESKDGDQGTSQGGIWRLSESNFDATKATELLDKIDEEFANEFSGFSTSYANLQWRDLDQPIFSGLAARLWLHLQERKEAIPTASDIGGQANYWTKYYNNNGEKQMFVEDVTQLLQDESCNINSDIIFVLDSSGSIGVGNYREVINFTYRFVEELDIGQTENQIGVVIYSDVGETLFNLSTYSDKQDVLEAIDNIPYIDRGTNTADGLCLMLEGFTEERGARLSEDNVIRLAIVMTDGHSNENSVICNGTTSKLAEIIHNYSVPITVFAIGVTDDVNQEELEAIASRNEYITHLETFSGFLFRRTVDEQTYELCEKVTIPVELGERRGSLSQGGTVRYELEIPDEGVTVKLCVSMGMVTFYGSYTIQNPNNALHDFKEEVTSSEEMVCGDVFVVPLESETTAARKKRQELSRNTTSTLYIALEGGGEQNEFILDTSEGDNTTDEEDDDEGVFTTTAIAAIAAGGAAVLLGAMVCSCILMVIVKRRGGNSSRTV